MLVALKHSWWRNATALCVIKDGPSRSGDGSNQFGEKIRPIKTGKNAVGGCPGRTLAMAEKASKLTSRLHGVHQPRCYASIRPTQAGFNRPFDAFGPDTILVVFEAMMRPEEKSARACRSLGPRRMFEVWLTRCTNLSPTRSPRSLIRPCRPPGSRMRRLRSCRQRSRWRGLRRSCGRTIGDISLVNRRAGEFMLFFGVAVSILSHSLRRVVGKLRVLLDGRSTH